jgi:hypothetical protein
MIYHYKKFLCIDNFGGEVKFNRHNWRKLCQIGLRRKLAQIIYCKRDDKPYKPLQIITPTDNVIWVD